MPTLVQGKLLELTGVCRGNLPTNCWTLDGKWYNSDQFSYAIWIHFSLAVKRRNVVTMFNGLLHRRKINNALMEVFCKNDKMVFWTKLLKTEQGNARIQYWILKCLSRFWGNSIFWPRHTKVLILIEHSFILLYTVLYNASFHLFCDERSFLKINCHFQHFTIGVRKSYRKILSWFSYILAIFLLHFCSIIHQ